MKVEKKVIGHLEKCYAVAPLYYNDKKHILVAAEKKSSCLLFDTEGNQEDVVWTEPGGTMSMVQVPGSDGQFLATHRFYSPNDSKDAEIVCVTPKAKGRWAVNTVVKMPFVHRFDILERNGVHYLIACTLKSDHRYKDDWSSPGKVYAAVLPDDLTAFSGENQLHFEVICSELTKNHGYYHIPEEDKETAVISAQDGVFRFIPPSNSSGKWEIQKILDEPCSDGVLIDLDGDGVEELAVISPFHSDTINIYKKYNDVFQKVYAYGKPAEFSHAIFGGELCGRPAVVIGHRKGDRSLIAFSFCPETGTYTGQILDSGGGAANIYKYSKGNAEYIVAANRENDEIVLYKFR